MLKGTQGKIAQVSQGVQGLRRAGWSSRRLQRGEFMMTRALLVVAILLVMLVVPIWWSRDKANSERKEEQRRAAASHVKAPVQAGAGAAGGVQAEPRPIGRGLSFALLADPRQPADTLNVGCHGDPAPQDHPHQGSCNPYEGDTSCRAALPVLCLKPGTERLPSGVESGFYKGWTGGTLAASQPVMGAILVSEAAAHGRCEAEFGPGWRMAEFHDGQGGWGLQAIRGGGAFSVGTRYWVHVNDQPGNCWNSKP